MLKCKRKTYKTIQKKKMKDASLLVLIKVLLILCGLYMNNCKILLKCTVHPLLSSPLPFPLPRPPLPRDSPISSSFGWSLMYSLVCKKPQLTCKLSAVFDTSVVIYVAPSCSTSFSLSLSRAPSSFSSSIL